MSPDLATVEQLRQLSFRYASACDARDERRYVEVFAPGGRLRVFDPADSPSPVLEFAGHDELVAVPRGLGRYERTFHLVANTSYAVDFERATGEVYCEAHHLVVNAGVASDRVMLIRYEDAYRRDETDWRIIDRRVFVQWTENHPVQGDRTEG